MTLPFLSGGPRQSSSVSLAISGTEMSVHSNDYNHTVQALQVHNPKPYRPSEAAGHNTVHIRACLPQSTSD